MEDLSETTDLYESITALDGVALYYAVLFNISLCVALIPDVKYEIFHVAYLNLCHRGMGL